jgi:hypothetical protein
LCYNENVKRTGQKGVITMTTAIDTRTVQREEAMRRLKALRLHENVVRDFASGKLNLSERAVFPGNRKKPFGILYWLNEDEKRAVKEFEAEYEAVMRKNGRWTEKN